MMVASVVAADPGRIIRLRLGLGFLLVGFLGHFFAAQAIGGSYVAYRDHMLGFFGLTLVSGAIIAGLGWRFWRGRHDITLFILGMLQQCLKPSRFAMHGCDRPGPFDR